jgi:hypothetical protein
MPDYHTPGTESNDYRLVLGPVALYRFRPEYRGPAEDRELLTLTNWLHRRWGYRFPTFWYRRRGRQQKKTWRERRLYAT